MLGLLVISALYWTLSAQVSGLMVLLWIAGLAFAVLTQINSFSVILHYKISGETSKLFTPAVWINIAGITSCCYLISEIWL